MTVDFLTAESGASPPISRRADRASRTTLALLAVATVVWLAPWSGKAFQMDDPLFLWSAQRILDNPLDFYGGEVNWFDYQEPLDNAIKNPPLASFYLAAIGGMTGFGEVPLHLAMIVPALGLILGTYALAGRMTASPTVAGAIVLVSPVFLLSATSMMCDVPMCALWVVSLWLWVRGIDDRRHGSLAVASLLMGACGLTKYFGICVIPLAALYGLLSTRRAGSWLLWLTIPLFILATFEGFARASYGQGFILGAATYSAQQLSTQGTGYVDRGVNTLVYAGASLVPLLFVAPWLWSSRGWLVGIVFALATGGWLAWRGHLASYQLATPEGIAWSPLVQMTIMLFTGAVLLALVATDAWTRRDRGSLLLGLWVVGTLTFTAWFNWTINGRAILPAAPAAAILLVRRLEDRWRIVGLAGGFRYAIPLIATAAISLSVGWADYWSAHADRAAALALAKKYTAPRDARRLWFEGHWGWQYYLEKRGPGASTTAMTPYHRATSSSSPTTMSARCSRRRSGWSSIATSHPWWGGARQPPGC